MKTPLIKEYLSRLLHQTWGLATGGIGFLVASVTGLFFPNLKEPIIYAAIFSLAIIVGSYGAFADLYQEFVELKECLEQAESKRPDIKVSFRDKSQRIVPGLQVTLRPLSPRLNFEQLVAIKRQELERNYQEARLLPLGKLNPRYHEEIEEFLVKYREYLEKKHRYSLAEDRMRKIFPIVVNQGNTVANNVIVEITLPPNYRPPTSRERAEFLLSQEYPEYAPLPPKEPKPVQNVFDDTVSVLRGLLSFRTYSPLAHLSPAQQTNTSDPQFEERDGFFVIVYHIKRLVPHHQEREFKPFLLWLPDLAKSTAWQLPVRIYAEELSYPQQANLRIDLKVIEGSSQEIESRSACKGSWTTPLS